MCTVLAVALAFASPVSAHFDANAQSRIILVERGEREIAVFIRVPAPLIYARELAERAPGAPLRADFVTVGTVAGLVVHSLDTRSIGAEPDAFGRKIASGYRITIDDEAPDPAVLGVAVHRGFGAPAFKEPDQARASLAGGSTVEAPDFGEAIVDLGLLYSDVDGARVVSIANILPEMQLAPGAAIDNHVVDFRGGGVEVVSVPGQLHEAVILDGSVLRAATTFVWQGIRHILEGPDHVLFVLCLTIAAASIGMLLWQVTGFTIGHSVTLIAGFLGFAPGGPWFVPAIETLIALSIVYAGLLAVWRHSGRNTVLITAAIGLLHGFGFAFVLGDILTPNSPHLLLSLVAFNIGVEIGQVAMVSVAFVLLLAAGWLNERLSRAVRVGIAGVSIVIAVYWVVERVQLVAGAVT